MEARGAPALCRRRAVGLAPDMVSLLRIGATSPGLDPEPPGHLTHAIFSRSSWGRVSRRAAPVHLTLINLRGKRVPGVSATARTAPPREKPRGCARRKSRRPSRGLSNVAAMESHNAQQGEDPAGVRRALIGF